MEVVLDNKSYHIPEEWVSRWDLLSNYHEFLTHDLKVDREDTDSSQMNIPPSAHITKKQMDKWIELNERMDTWTPTDNYEENVRDVSNGWTCCTSYSKDCFCWNWLWC